MSTSKQGEANSMTSLSFSPISPDGAVSHLLTSSPSEVSVSAWL